MRIAVLCYHSSRVAGNEYSNNDHIAFAADLEWLLANRVRIVSLFDVALGLLGEIALPDRAIALSFDDGTDFDYLDLDWPGYGLQVSFAHVLRIAARKHRDQQIPPATAFVVADPAARRELDQRCLHGQRRLNDFWWSTAVGEGHFLVANHSWDHAHPELARYRSQPDAAMRFARVTDYATADAQIRRAAAYIRARAPNPGLSLFAYPFGTTTDYLVQEYLPRYQHEHGILAAFTTEPAVIHECSNRWTLPRFVCGSDWNEPEALSRIVGEL